MIVECSNCQTRFQLDDARIPARGIRVRCSRCKEAFFLEHPSASKAEVVEDVAKRALTGAAAPEATRDLPASRSGGRAEPDEEEWEFNDAPRVDPKAQRGADARKRRAPPKPKASAGLDDEDSFGADRAVAAADDDGPIPGLGIDDTGADGGIDSGSGLDLAGDVPERGRIDFSGLKDVRVDAESGSDFGVASDFSALADDELEAEPLGSPSESAPKGISKPAAKSGPKASANTGGGKTPSKPGAKAKKNTASGSDESGEAEDWDFFSDEALEPPASMDDAPGRGMDVVHEDKPRAAASRGPALGKVPTSSSSRFAALRWVGNAIGWLVTLALIGAGVSRGVLHLGAPQPAPLTSVQIGELRAEAVRGSWLDTMRSTRLYAVTGKLMNEGPRPVVLGNGFQASLVGADGLPLDLPPVRAGMDLSQADLRELTAEGLATSREQAAAILATAPIDPGRWISFQVVFDEMPVQATGFVLGMAEGSAPVPLPVPDAPRVPGVESVVEPAAQVAPPTPLGQPVEPTVGQAAGQAASAPVPSSSLPPELRASYGASPTEPVDPQPSRP